MDVGELYRVGIMTKVNVLSSVVLLHDDIFSIFYDTDKNDKKKPQKITISSPPLTNQKLSQNKLPWNCAMVWWVVPLCNNVLKYK